MANAEQLAILRQGVEVWNRWREENPNVEIDLSRADLKGAFLNEGDFRRANLFGADLRRTNLREANLSEANFIEANLGGAHLTSANLSEARLNVADLRGVDFCEADLSGADLREADLSRADLQQTDLREADLRGANLREANLSRADLRKANFHSATFIRSHLDARVGETIFGNSDLSETIGLENVSHWGPSSISIDTFVLSEGKIPEIFLRGCGLSDWEIEEVKLYNPNLSNDEVNKILYSMYDLRATQALQISPLFVSYNHTDSGFVNKIGDSLTELGIRYWRDIHEMKAGRIEKQIDRAIRQNPTVLLVLSEHSLNSDWVEHEVRKARELEKELARDTLCPVTLDNSWTSSRWPKRIMEQIMEYNILDFSAWEDDVKFEGMFRKLIDGLELFYKG